MTIDTIVKDGMTVTLSVATRTTNWIRSEVAIGPAGEVLKKSVTEWAGPLPSGTGDTLLWSASTRRVSENTAYPSSQIGASAATYKSACSEQWN
ncbi:hypothetical protein EMCG_09278 [[Emmonsia] crescens]|uniref:Uncharacterized protein n=1 Tax=[Emmonsia] crescens TaxID=73230 RepID=A0A0G2I3N9_9EURO|nr:hypothetical protein EMCG_09278 [Emmonsia crescens UAMH 3008]